MLARLTEMAHEPGSRTAHLVPVMDLATKLILSHGMGFTLHPLTTIGAMDHWTWDCLLVVAQAMNAPPAQGGGKED